MGECASDAVRGLLGLRLSPCSLCVCVANGISGVSTAASLVNCAAPPLIDVSIVSAPAVTNAEQAPVAEYVAPVTTVTYAAPLQSSSI